MSESYDEVTERAPQDDDGDAASGLRRRGRADEPDVLLDVSELRVDEISLEVLDHATADRVLAVLLDTVEELGAALVVTNHDQRVARRMPRRWRMTDGSLTAEVFSGETS